MNQKDVQADLNRRSFLKGGSFATLMMMMGAVEITAQTATTKPAAPKPEKKVGPPVKCGVIGVGTWGRDLITYLSRLPNAPITAVAETYGASLRRAKSGAPNATPFEDYRQLLDSKDVEAVIVATPTHQHKEIVLAALQAGKHVYCEAPLAHTIEDARAIAQAAKNASKQVFQAGLQYRANPQHHHVLEFVRTGAAGNLTLARAQYHKKESWRRTSPSSEREKELNWRLNQKTSPGLVGEIGIHSIDVASWFLRANPVSVTGFGSIMHWKDGRNVADTAQAIVEYPNGARMVYDATLTNSYEGNYDVYSGTDAAVLVRENRAWMFKEADSPLLGWEVYAKKDTFPATGEAGIALVANATQLIAQGLKPAEAAADGDQPAYYSLESFIECINEKKAPDAGWKEGFEATVVGLKANEAVNTNSKIVIDPKLFEV